MTRHRIAIVVGSLRRDSINRKVAKSICAFAGKMLDCYIVEIGDLPLYNQDEEASPSSAVLAFRKQIGKPMVCCSARRNTTGAFPAS